MTKPNKRPQYLNAGTVVTPTAITTTWRNSRGASRTAVAPIDLTPPLKRRPLTILKSALAAIEEQSGLRFETWEVVDVTRTFIQTVLAAGHKIHGFSAATEPTAETAGLVETLAEGFDKVAAIVDGISPESFPSNYTSILNDNLLCLKQWLEDADAELKRHQP